MIYKRLCEEPYKKYDENILNKLQKHSVVLFKMSDNFATDIEKIKDSSSDIYTSYLDIIEEYPSLFPVFTDIGFNLKYSKKSDLEKFLFALNSLIETEAFSLNKVRVIVKNIQAILKKFRYYQSILNNIHIALKSNKDDEKLKKKVMTLVSSSSLKGYNALKSITTGISTLIDFIEEQSEKPEYFVNDFEKNYKGILVGIRLSDELGMNRAKQSLKQSENFIDFCYKYKFSQYIKPFKKLVISSRSYYPVITGSEEESAVAFFLPSQNLIFIPYDFAEPTYINWVIYHEFAHYFYQIAKKKLSGDFYRLWNKTWNRYKNNKQAYPTQYAYTNRNEAFSEVFAWYFCPKNLRGSLKVNSVHPDVLKAFVKILELLKVKTKEV